ncbi:class I SAM-dependent methyltransferase [Leifsonia sp. Leaf264]|uniref:class I SAM-dependent methyltransferase n=1 Tax=Leifsonia sp. Leaf264 TaxID=1736314 RepID=UPI0006FDFA17|nr:class I SAM-dependent methyltransferase [Leifsonia sp. Leaf264]KQO99438.1 methyltransferase type 11 [Leifsonia sp. Leaf264]
MSSGPTGRATPPFDSPTAPSTRDSAYTDRLVAKQTATWKRVLNVQAPYRWNLRRLDLGFVLDIGCGIGRNLQHLGSGVGVDHNADSISVVRERGFPGFTPEEFHASEFAVAGRFDSLLLSHVLEHMDAATGRALLAEYLPYLRPGGRVCVITPQERGYASDATHELFVDFAGIEEVFADLGLEPVRQYSFPFPRWAGRAFIYNEFIAVAVSRRAGD